MCIDPKMFYLVLDGCVNVYEKDRAVIKNVLLKVENQSIELNQKKATNEHKTYYLDVGGRVHNYKKKTEH